MSFTEEALLAALAGYMTKATTDPQLIMINRGFMMYPIERKATCRTIMAPRVDHMPHSGVLAVLTESIERQPDLPTTIAKEMTEFILDGVAVTPADGVASASIHRSALSSLADLDFSAVPDFTNMACGFELDPTWRQAKDLHFTFDLLGGNLTALADEKTCAEEWKWPKCDGTENVQRVTSWTLHSSDAMRSRTLNFRKLDGTDLGALTLRPTYLNFVLAVLRNDPPDGKSGVRVEVEHFRATIKLCVPDGKPLCVPTKIRLKSPCSTTFQPPSMDPHVIKVILEYLKAHADYWDGTPECSPRQIPA